MSGRVTVVRVLLSRGMPKERLLLCGLTLLCDPLPNVRLRSGLLLLSLLMLPKVRVPLLLRWLLAIAGPLPHEREPLRSTRKPVP